MLYLSRIEHDRRSMVTVCMLYILSDTFISLQNSQVNMYFSDKQVEWAEDNDNISMGNVVVQDIAVIYITFYNLLFHYIIFYNIVMITISIYYHIIFNT